MTRVRIAPSILASDFLHLGDAIRAAESGGADCLHYDVMDGQFVPNISMGPAILAAIRTVTQLPIEAHLMIVEPERYVAAFAEAGADVITIHAEVAPHLYRVLEQIHEAGKRAGVAINPATPLAAIEEVLDLADVILVMTVNPGFGGQSFLAPMERKVRLLRETLHQQGLDTEIEVDGGIDSRTSVMAVEAGARTLVAGTSVFRSPAGVVKAIQDLRSISDAACAALES